MGKRVVQDERIQLERYKAGYYAFMVGGGLYLVYYFLWSAVEFHNSLLTGIMPHVVLVGATGTFYIYRMVHYNKAVNEERWLRRKQAPYRWVRSLLTIPAVAAYVVIADYFIRATTEGEEIIISERWFHWVVMTAVFTILMIVFQHVRPSSLDSGDSFPTKRRTESNATNEE